MLPRIKGAGRAHTELKNSMRPHSIRKQFLGEERTESASADKGCREGSYGTKNKEEKYV